MADQEREIQLLWSGAESTPLQFVNQIVAQLGAGAGPEGVPDGVHLTFGLASQPIFVGSEDSVRRQYETLQTVEVQTAARLVMSRERAEELLHILAGTVAQYDEITRVANHARA